MKDQPTQPCEAKEASLSAYLDGELQPQEIREVEAHLRTCRECASMLEELRSAIQVVGSIPSPRTPAGFKERLLQRIQVEVETPPRAPLPAWVRVAATGLAASLLIVLTLHLGGLIGGPRYAPKELASAPRPSGEVGDLDRPPSLRPAAERPGPRRDGTAEGRKRSAPAGPLKTPGLRTEEKGGFDKDTVASHARAPGEEVPPAGAPEASEPVAAIDFLAKEMDTFEKFKRDAPQNQTLQIAWSNGEGWRALNAAIQRYQSQAVGEEDGRLPTLGAPTETEADLGAARRSAPLPGARGGEGATALGEKAVAKQILLLRLQREKYPEFLDALDELDGVEYQEGPDKDRWDRWKSDIKKVLEQHKAAPKAALEREEMSDDPTRLANGYFRAGEEALEEDEEGEAKAEEGDWIQPSRAEKRLPGKKKGSREIKRSLLRRFKEAVQKEEVRHQRGIVDVQVNLVD